MNSLDLAIRRYQQIVPTAITRPHDLPTEALRVWVNEQLRKCLEDYVGRPCFRYEATWPLWALRSGADTPERALIDLTATRVEACAKALKKLVQKKLVLRKLNELYPARIPTPAGAVTLLGSRTVPKPSKSLPRGDAGFEGSRIAAMADGCPELVDEHDYFWPEQVYEELDDGTRLQRGEFIVSLNDDLLVPGNFIVRCLLKRIRIRLSILRSFRDMVLRALRGTATYAQERVALRAAWSDLTSIEKQVETLFGGGQQTRLRDACVGMTQLYAATHPSPELRWLGITDYSIDDHVTMLRQEISGQQSPQFFERIAQVLHDLRRLPAVADPAQSEVEEAVAGGGLVLIGSNHLAFWQTALFSEPLTKGDWKMLHALAEKARLESQITITDIFGHAVVTESAMSSAWGRLKRKLPPSFSKLVKPGNKPATYRLELDARRISNFS